MAYDTPKKRATKLKKAVEESRNEHHSLETSYDRFINFWVDIGQHLTDPNVQQWLSILEIDQTSLVDLTRPDCYHSARKFARAYVSRYTRPVVLTLLDYIDAIDKDLPCCLDFLRMYSDEQIKYITYVPEIAMSHTKLMACAGSGKTRTIIGRIKFMVEQNLAKKDEVFAITFSRLAAEDFHTKIRQLFPEPERFCNLKNFSTIDSLAKAILCRVRTHKSDNVEILSIAFRNYLKDATPDEIKFIRKVKPVKHLFIDEAQDLSECQFDIARMLKDKLGTIIHLVGDPNQNIYQFRNSSSTYLLNFDAKQFDLTLNWRSSQQIIDFADGLKPVPSRTISATNKSGPLVTIISDSQHAVHGKMLKIIRDYPLDKSNIAIICPTKGTGAYDSVGLSVVFNLLKTHKIPFIQLYCESGASSERVKIVERKEGCVNLMTYHGTKGLEFDTVFVMDFYQFLFNIKPSEPEHTVHQYLLYVATSRAINRMFICTYTNVHGGYLNHWLTKVDTQCYESGKESRIPRLNFRDDTPLTVNGITDLLGELSDEQLDFIDDMIRIKTQDPIYTRRIYKDFTHIDRCGDETLFGIFCEELFYWQYYLSRQMAPRSFTMINLILESRFLITETEAEFKLLQSFVQTDPTWELYDEIKYTMPTDTVAVVEKYLKRDQLMSGWIVCTNKFVEIVQLNMDDIYQTYRRYLDPSSYKYDYRPVLSDFFYLILVQYAYNINHYYYLNNHGAEKSQLLMNGIDLYEAINRHVSGHYYNCELKIKVPVSYTKLMIVGEIDFMTRRRVFHKIDDPNVKDDVTELFIDTIVEIKCVKEISIKHYIQLMLYNFCYNYQHRIVNKTFTNSYKIINLLTGLEYYLVLEINPSNMFNMLVVLAEAGNLVFRDMNLVYDLETTDLIRTTKQGNQLITVYPDITEITIKDYDTDMVILNTLIKPTKAIHPEVTKKTGLTLEKLASKMTMDEIKPIFNRKIRRIATCKLLAHNGAQFDHKIVRHYNLFDTSKCKINFLDTLSLIPMHWPGALKLERKSQEYIYSQLFTDKYDAHRSDQDVDALIRIMRKLNIIL